jgi:RNA polymerase sigma factor (sigma-70 family)
MMIGKPSFRAIVVEDDSSWQQILSEILTDSGLSVDVADNLEEALKILKAEPHRLAVVDLSLEGSDHHNDDGLRILEALKRLDPPCQSILLTGFATVDLAVSVLTEYGAFSFLRKENFNRAQFRQLIQQALATAPVAEVSTPATLKSDRSFSSAKVEGYSERSGKVLVVDDDAGWRSILSELLTDGGYGVRVCSSYGDALGSLRREKFLLAVVDLSLTSDPIGSKIPTKDEMEGYQLLADARASGIPTIVVSGVASVDEIQRAYNEQAVFAFLEKQSFDRSTFRLRVQEALSAFHHDSEFNQLTQREREVFDLLAKGLSNKEIAETLVITNNTVKRHLKSVFEKLDVHSRAGAISKARGK